MSHLAIRQSGGANIVSIPKAILKTLGLHVGSTLDLSIVDCKIEPLSSWMVFVNEPGHGPVHEKQIGIAEQFKPYLRSMVLMHYP